MISLKRKISKSLNSNLMDDYQVLEDAVKVFQKALDIKQPTVVTLKKKIDMWAVLTGTCFYNSAVNKICCHIYVHRHSTVLGTLILIAHEMVHAWQIDTKQPGNKAAWEEQAVELSLAMVEELHVKRYPDRVESLARAEVHHAWGWLH